MVKNMLPRRQIPRSSVLLLLATCAATAVWVSGRAFAEPPRPPARVIVDWRTGLALHGMDPVAYFSDRSAVQGSAALELTFADATFRFRNEGNRAAFAAAPEVYLPRFGGYDPIAIGRGVATPGNPLVWHMFGGRLYLFHTLAARTAFVADPQRGVAAAAVKWPVLLETGEITGTTPTATPAPADGVPPADRHKR